MTYKYYEIGTLRLRDFKCPDTFVKDADIFVKNDLHPFKNLTPCSVIWNNVDLSWRIFVPMKENDKYKATDNSCDVFITDKEIENYKKKLQKFNINL